MQWCYVLREVFYITSQVDIVAVTSYSLGRVPSSELAIIGGRPLGFNQALVSDLLPRSTSTPLLACAQVGLLDPTNGISALYSD